MEIEVSESRNLSAQLKEREISNGQWHTLSKSLFPGAKPESVLMVIDYCKARGLDPMKKPCHIVPMDVRVGNNYEKRDVVMPGIYEYRTTAQKTGEYMGHSIPEYGDKITIDDVDVPEWCAITVYRWNEASQQRVEFPVKVWFSEVYATRYDKSKNAQVINARWSKAPRQMLTKCTEAAALREAFPDELGGEMTYEEMVDQAPIEIEPGQQVFTMSKQAVTKIKKAMDAAIEEDDPSAIWETYQECSDEEWTYVTNQLDRWRTKDWEEALKKGMAWAREVNGEEFDFEPREKDAHREQVRANA